MPASVVPPRETVTPAIVVRARSFGESDKIVTFLTRDLGKLSGIAKGAKRSKRRFVNVLEPFTHVNVRLRERASSDLAFINACELLDAYHTFARDLTKFAHASYVLELTDRMVRGHEAGADTYELVRDVLAFLERSQPGAGMLRAFELQLLRLTGYEAQLDRCRRCGTGIGGSTTMYAQPARGGIVCGRCRGDGRTYVASPETLVRLSELQRARFGDADDATFSLLPGASAEARVVIRGFFANTLSAPLASEKLLESL